MEIVGTDLKYAFWAGGAFNMTTMEWDMEFVVGAKKVTMRKRNVEGAYQLSCDAPNMGFKPTSDGRWVFLLDSSFFGPGRLVAYLYAHIPDSDFDPNGDFSTLDSIRNEIRKYSLETIMPK